MERSSAKGKRREEDVRVGGTSDEREYRGWLLWRKEEDEDERSVARSSDVHRLVDASVAGDDGAFLPTDDNRPRKK